MTEKTSRELMEFQCERLVKEFYGLLDEKRYRELSMLFAEDGVWIRLGEELRGRRAILAAMHERADWLTAHVLTNCRVDLIDDDHAKTVQYITLYRHEGWGADDGPAPVVLPLGVLRHTDKLVRKSGKWMFARKASKAIMVDRQRVTHYDRN